MAILDIQNCPKLRNRFADRRDVWFSGGVWLNLDFLPRGLHTRTAVGRNPRDSYAFLFFTAVLATTLFYKRVKFSAVAES